MNIRLEQRLNPSRATQWLVTPVSLLMALIAGGLILTITGVNPFVAYKAMLVGALGSPYSVSETLVKTTPLLLTSLAYIVASMMKFHNLGIEGQLVIGGFFSGAVALFIPGLWQNIPSALLLIIMFVAGILGGILWGLIPALLRAFLQVNEVIVTILMNYIAILFSQYFFLGPWRDPKGMGFPGSPIFVKAAWLPKIPGTRVHLGLFIALIAAILIWVIINKTKFGYEIRVIGANSKAAKCAGINLVHKTILVMILSGGIAGIAGMTETAGILHRLMDGIAVGYGYTAILVVNLALRNPIASILVSFLIATLLVGGDQLQMVMLLPASFAHLLQGVILFFFLAGTLFQKYRLRIDRPQKILTAQEETCQ